MRGSCGDYRKASGTGDDTDEAHRARKRARHQNVERCEYAMPRMSALLVATQGREPPPTGLFLLQVLFV